VTWKNIRYWLKPGIRVKRYLALAGFGFLLSLLGAGVLGRSLAEGGGREALFAGGGAIALGALLLVLGVRWMNRSILAVLEDPDEVPKLVFQKRRLAQGPKIVAMGGGTGLSRLLKGLKDVTTNTTAVVATTDDGGSTGRLRRAFDIPAVGDLVDCLAALSEAPRAPELMQYRFTRGGELAGHTFGNLFLVTLHELTGSFAEALRSANRMLALSGWVWPSTVDPAVLAAEFEDGRVIQGETEIRKAGGRIRRLALLPEDPAVMPEVVAAIAEAEMVVLGPGSLFTSVIASFLPQAVRRAVRESPAPLVQVVNLMTEPGETDGMDAFAHVEALAAHLGRWPDVVLVHTGPIAPGVRRRYAAEGRYPVAYDPRPFRERGIRVVTGDFAESGRFAQHDPEKLKKALLALHAETAAAPAPV